MKRLYVILCVSFLIILLCGCADSKEKKSIAIIRQFTGLNSGVKKLEYHLCLTQKEIEDLLRKKYDELGYLPPIMGFPEISNFEICLFIFMGERDTDALFAEVIEEQNKIIFRVGVPSYQVLIPVTRIKTSDGQTTEVIDESKIHTYNTVTPFGYFVLPKTDKKIIVEFGPIEKGPK